MSEMEAGVFAVFKWNTQPSEEVVDGLYDNPLYDSQMLRGNTGVAFKVKELDWSGFLTTVTNSYERVVDRLTSNYDVDKDSLIYFVSLWYNGCDHPLTDYTYDELVKLQKE